VALPKVEDPEVMADVQAQPEPEPVPNKKPKTEEVAPVQVKESASVEAENEATTEEADKSPKKPPVQTKWNQLKVLLKRKEAKEFVSFMDVSKKEDNPATTVTIVIGSCVWSQTVPQHEQKMAKEQLAQTVLDHFEIEDVSKCHPDEFNCGLTPTGLLVRFLGDAHSFSTEETKEGDSANPKHTITLTVNDEDVETIVVNSRSNGHQARANMAIKYIAGHMDDYIKTITDYQNKAAQAAQNPNQAPNQNQHQAQGQFSQEQMMAFQQQMLNMQRMMANGQNGGAAFNGQNGNGEEQHQISPASAESYLLGQVNQAITDGSTWNLKHMNGIFKNCLIESPVGTLYAHCTKEKIKFTLETAREEEQAKPWTTTVKFEDDDLSCTIHGVGPGKKSKEIAAVAALNYLKQQGRFDETGSYLNSLVKKIKAGEPTEMNPAQMIEYMKNILEETPSWVTDEGTPVDVDGRQTKEYTTTLDFAGFKGVGKSVSGKKASKKSAVLDWVIKYERANSVVVNDIIEQYKEKIQKKKTEKSKESLAKLKERQAEKRKEEEKAQE